MPDRACKNKPGGFLWCYGMSKRWWSMEATWKMGRSKGIVLCWNADIDHSIFRQCNLQTTSSLIKIQTVQTQKGNEAEAFQASVL